MKGGVNKNVKGGGGGGALREELQHNEGEGITFGKRRPGRKYIRKT